MSVFGDYETIGRPWFLSRRHGRLRNSWKATCRVGEDQRVYFIKSIVLPAPPEGKTVGGPGPVEDFFESIRRLQEAHKARPDLIAPILAFGKTEAEVWYATEVYPRHSLAELDFSTAEINHRTLRHVVYGVASGCLALQRTSGLSHGNLKAGNVLLDGESGPLRRTQLHLIDAAGSAFVPTQGPLAGNLREVTERHDLRRIGEIVLELVERNPIDGPEDYSLPIAYSSAWRALGSHSRRWLDLCNRLLDPELSLERISLESLAKEFKPYSARTALLFSGLSAIAITNAAVVAFALWTGDLKIGLFLPPRSPFETGGSTPPRDLERENSASKPQFSHSNAEGTVAPFETKNSRGSDSTVSESPIPQPEPSIVEATSLSSNSPPVAFLSADPNTAAVSAESTSPMNAIASRLPEVGAASSAKDPTDSRVATPAPGPGAPALSLTGPLAQREAKPDRQLSVKPAELPTRGVPRQTELARTGTAQGPSSAKGARLPLPAPLDMAKVNVQLLELETEVARIVAIRRDSDLFDRAKALEARCARANQLSGNLKKRFDILHLNLTRKLPGAAPERPSIEPTIPPVAERPPVSSR